METDRRASWVRNDDGDLVPRRTGGTARRYSQEDFTLACHFCGDDYGNEPDLPIGVVGAHFEKHHPESVSKDDGPKVVLDMLWLGQGPAPKGNVK